MIVMTSPLSVLLVLEQRQAHPCVLAHILPSLNDRHVIRPSGRLHWASVEVSRSRAVPQPPAGMNATEFAVQAGTPFRLFRIDSR
jgi:hypothetical protein